MSWEVIAGGIVAIVAGVVGWLSIAANEWLRLRREDKVAIGKLLVSLAEIRFQLTTTHLYFERVAKKVPITNDDMSKARLVMGKLLPQLDQFGNNMTMLYYISQDGTPI